MLLFFWAHWCPDCKQEEHLLAQIRQEYAPRGLVIIAPTQRYGYVARGEEAGPAEELKYIEEVPQEILRGSAERPRPRQRGELQELRRQHHAHAGHTGSARHRALYHPGAMTLDELRAALNRIG